MWAIQFKSALGWSTCVGDVHKSTLQVFLFREEAEREYEKYKHHAFEHRLIEVEIVVK
jgi:hypothetical protein